MVQLRLMFNSAALILLFCVAASSLTVVHSAPAAVRSVIGELPSKAPEDVKILNRRHIPLQNCKELYDYGFNESGLYVVQPNDNGGEFVVFCDMTLLGGGWTVIQRRVDGQLRFDRNFVCYRNGFGDLWKDFWLGLEKIHRLTQYDGTPLELYIGLESFHPRYPEAFAHYTNFEVKGNDESYMLQLSGYNSSSTAGDSLSTHSGQKFSTYDSDQDKHVRNCAKIYKGGWWYRNCHESNLNGIFYEDGSLADWDVPDGIIWEDWVGDQMSLKSTVMAIRPQPAEVEL